MKVMRWTVRQFVSIVESKNMIKYTFNTLLCEFRLAKYPSLLWSPANCPFPATLGHYLHDTRHRDIIRVMHGVT